MADSSCVLCDTDGGEVIFSTDLFRVVWAEEPLYPGFLRLIWNSHVKEFSGLSKEHRYLCIDALVILEKFLLEDMKADKVNLASLGNVVPHLHWHVIPRFKDDPHFPAPVWSVEPAQAKVSSNQKNLLERKRDLIHLLKTRLTKIF